MTDAIKLILFVVPLGLDTLAVSTAIGLLRPSGRARLRLSLVMSGFEMTMPLLGLLIGRSLGRAVGGWADWLAFAILVALGLYMVVGSERAEPDRVASFASAKGVALIALGVAVSLDEFAIGFTIGLLGLSIAAAVILIGAQAFVFAQVGMRLGSRIGQAAQERAEKLAGIALLGLGLLLAAEHAIR